MSNDKQRNTQKNILSRLFDLNLNETNSVKEGYEIHINWVSDNDNGSITVHYDGSVKGYFPADFFDVS